MTSFNKLVSEAIDAVRHDDYLRGLTLFLEAYGSDEDAPVKTTKAATGLSYFGLCLALVQKKYKAAIDLCRRAVDLEFYNGDHYANLVRVYVAAGNRKKALETAEAGLRLLPEHAALIAARRSIGVRARPAVPFLDRANPINVSLGQSRHAKKVAEMEGRRKK